ncbi:MAG: glycoside hydrolase family 13 [Fervidobacterium sp.]
MKKTQVGSIVVILLIVISASQLFGAVEYKEGKVVFTFKADASIVYLAGNFNNWNPTAWPMKLVNGVWTYEVELKPGSYQYKYVIEGKTWKEDPEAPLFVDDGFGGKNGAFTLTEDGKIIGISSQQTPSKKYELNTKRENTIFVDQDGYVVIRVYAKDAKHVFIAGSFNNWKDNDTECYYVDTGWWEAVLELTPGIYEYKFIIDGNWMVDPNAFAFTDDGFGGKNGVIEVAKEGGKLFVRAPQGAVTVDEKSSQQKVQVLQANATETVIQKVTSGLSVVGKNVVFAVKKENAQEAYLAGSFNNWNARALKMQFVEGYWLASVQLQPGIYRYKYVFVIGGTDTWEEDPNAPSYEPDGYGGKNGVFKLVEKDGKLVIEGVEEKGGLPVKGEYTFNYQYKTSSTQYLVSNTFSNKLTLTFKPNQESAISVSYDGAGISTASLKFAANGYSINMFYKSPYTFFSDQGLYSLGKKTGLSTQINVTETVSLMAGVGYESGKLPWIVGVITDNFKLYVSDKYFSEDLGFIGEIKVPSFFNLSFCGMYNLDNSMYASISLSSKQFGLYLSFNGLSMNPKIYSMFGEDKITIGGKYDFYYGNMESYVIYTTKEAECYLGTDLSNVEFKLMLLSESKDLGFGIKTSPANFMNNTYVSVFGTIRF